MTSNAISIAAKEHDDWCERETAKKFCIRSPGTAKSLWSENESKTCPFSFSVVS
jgi:hypothetical protein